MATSGERARLVTYPSEVIRRVVMPTHSLHRGGPTFPLAAPVVTNNARKKNVDARAQSPILQGGLVAQSRRCEEADAVAGPPIRSQPASRLPVFRRLFDCFGHAHTEKSRIPTRRVNRR